MRINVLTTRRVALGQGEYPKLGALPRPFTRDAVIVNTFSNMYCKAYSPKHYPVGNMVARSIIQGPGSRRGLNVRAAAAAGAAISPRMQVYWQTAVYKGEVRSPEKPEYELNKAVEDCMAQLTARSPSIPEDASLAIVFISTEFAIQFEGLVAELRKHVPSLKQVFGTTASPDKRSTPDGHLQHASCASCLSSSVLAAFVLENHCTQGFGPSFCQHL